MSRVVLGVSGSVAAFKGAVLAGELVQRGHQVRAVLTSGATHFVAPLTFEALTGCPVPVQVWDESGQIGHLELARWAEVLAVAPASAGVLSRLALGLSDDMLGAVALAYTGPLLLAPAMESNMYRHPATQSHLRTLRERGAVVAGPASGRLASGAEGVGRMVEPADLVRAIESLLGPRDLEGKRILVTAGPTYEAIDPVRFIGNRSSGKMGYAVAQEAARRGAYVVLVSGPVSLPPPRGVDVVRVETAAEMREAVLSRAPDHDVIVMAAAVADFRPAVAQDQKIKRAGDLDLHLVATDDIAAEAVKVSPRTFHVGFALGSADLIQEALAKLRRKGQDLVVANSISPNHNPFGSDSNRVALVSADGVEEFDEMPKAEVAHLLWDRVVARLGRAKE